MKTTSINELYALLLAILIDRTIIYTLPKACQGTGSIILNHTLIDIATTVTISIKIIIAQMDFMAVFTESFHLIMYFLANTADIRKAMIDKE